MASRARACGSAAASADGEMCERSMSRTEEETAATTASKFRWWSAADAGDGLTPGSLPNSFLYISPKSIESQSRIDQTLSLRPATTSTSLTFESTSFFVSAIVRAISSCAHARTGVNRGPCGHRGVPAARRGETPAFELRGWWCRCDGRCLELEYRTDGRCVRSEGRWRSRARAAHDQRKVQGARDRAVELQLRLVADGERVPPVRSSSRARTRTPWPVRQELRRWWPPKRQGPPQVPRTTVSIPRIAAGPRLRGPASVADEPRAAARASTRAASPLLVDADKGERFQQKRLQLEGLGYRKVEPSARQRRSCDGEHGGEFHTGRRPAVASRCGRCVLIDGGAEINFRVHTRCPPTPTRTMYSAPPLVKPIFSSR